MTNLPDLFDFAAGDRYLALLNAATPDQWERFARALDSLRGDDIRAVWRRASTKLINGERIRRTVAPAYYLTTGAMVAIELLAEFAGPIDPASMVAHMRRMKTEDPVRRRIEEQWADAIEIAHRRLPSDAVALERVQDGANLVWAWRAIRDEEMRPSWGALEIVAPLESLGLDRAS